MGLLKMAWRNLWRNSRRSLVTVAAMTLALFVMVLYTSMVEGYLVGLERNILDVEMGDLHVYARDYRDHPSIYTTIESAQGLVPELETRGYRASARLLGAGLVASGDSSAGAAIKGVEVDRDVRVSGIHEHLRQGEWLSQSDPRGLVLGSRLARALGVGLGDELVLLSQATDGSMANDLYSVRGVLRAISDGTDRAGVFMIADEFRSFFLLADGAHQIIVRRPDDRDLEAAATEVRSLAQGLDVATWRELLPTLANMMDSTRALISVVFLIVYIAIAILILNAMLMAVFERIREFGMLKAIGGSPALVLALIVIEGALQAGLAIVVGLGLSLPALWFLVRHGIDMGRLGGISIAGMALVDSNWRGVVSAYTFLGPLVVLVVIVALALLYPGIKAARISPIEAMRYQ